MARASNRDRILTEGLKVVHERGFGSASVRDIVAAAGVPQGSFTNHFGSKEAFGLEIMDIYLANSRETIGRTLLNETLKPLDRLRAFVDANRTDMASSGMRNGCLYGNFSAEAGTQSEPIRLRLIEIFAEVEEAVATCLRAAIDAGDITGGQDAAALAGFVVSSLQGAILIGKARHDVVPIDIFTDILFSRILC